MFSEYGPAVPHAYTRFFAAFASGIAVANVLQGLSWEPHEAPSVPPGDTNIPNFSLMTQESAVVDGGSESGKQSPEHE
jgi:hypothetical protein